MKSQQTMRYSPKCQEGATKSEQKHNGQYYWYKVFPDSDIPKGWYATPDDLPKK